MTIGAIRRRLALTLILLALAGIGFYWRQNAGLQVGGPISPPKMFWLAYALAAWFFLPLFLWRDERLAVPVRRIFLAFWIAMMVRGAAELVLMYGFQHWNPRYGISHDIFCMGLIWLLRRRAVVTDGLNRRALGFSGSIFVSLVAEVTFAGMFLQTKAHQEAVYFAAPDASWGYINLVTSTVLLFVYPDLVVTLVTLYFPGFVRDTPPKFPRTKFQEPNLFYFWFLVLRIWDFLRMAAATFTVLVAVSALAFWTHMMRTEAEAKRFQEVGYDIVNSCTKFKEAFVQGDEIGMRDFIEQGDGSWRLEKVDHSYPFELTRWHPLTPPPLPPGGEGGVRGRQGGPTRTFLEAILEWRRALPQVLQAAFKMHLLDEVVSDREAVCQIRFEVTGKNTTDSGLLRCRFRRGEDGRWRVTESSLIEGTSVSGPGNYFVDVASERGIDFVMEPDRRFVPGAKCGCPDEEAGPSRLKFQTMRHAYAGCATADFDGDGHDDVLFCSGGTVALYRNRGDGTFENVTEKAGLANLWHINTGGFADLDNDGYPDLFLSAFYGKTYLFKNNGNGTFTDVTAQSGIRNDGTVTCFCFFDYNNDGKLDLYLGRFLDARHDIPDSFLYARNGQGNVLYRNDGHFHFTDVTQEAGVGEHGLALSVAAADYDGDGHQDLFVANDFGRSVLYKNLGNGTFQDVTLETGCLAIGGSMSASWGDFNNDGRLDLYVAAIRSNQRWFVQPITARRVLYKYIREGRLLGTNPVFQDLKKYMGENWVNIGNEALAGNYLFRQNADGTFTNVAEAAGARPAGWYWSSGFFDIHNRGLLDIYATDGWISGPNPYDL